MIDLHDPDAYPPYPVPVPEPFPEPIVRSTDPISVPVPVPVAKTESLAQAAGWETCVTYSRGHQPHATHGRPGPAPVEMWAVRMRKGDLRAVAVRTGPAWDMLYTWSPREPWTKSADLGSLRWKMIVGAPLPPTLSFAEPMASKKRGPEHVRLVDGAVYALPVGELYGPDPE